MYITGIPSEVDLAHSLQSSTAIWHQRSEDPTVLEEGPCVMSMKLKLHLQENTTLFTSPFVLF